MRRGRRGPFTSIATHVVPGPGLLTSVKRMLLRSGGRAKLQSETRKSWTSCAVLTSWCHQWSWEDSSGVWGCWAAATDSHGTTSYNGYNNLIKLNNTKALSTVIVSLWIKSGSRVKTVSRPSSQTVKTVHWQLSLLNQILIILTLMNSTVSQHSVTRQQTTVSWDSWLPYLI